MKSGQSHWWERLAALLAAPRPEPAEHARRIVALQRHIILPARLLVVGIVIFQIFTSRWLGVEVNTYVVVFETIKKTFAGYALLVLAVTALFYVVRRFPPGTVQWTVFAIGLGDGVFLAGLTVLTGGFESILYWVYPALIVLNAISIPLATPQIVLNLVLVIFFLGAGLIETSAQLELTLPGLRPRSTRKNFTAVDIKDAQALAIWLNQSPAPVSSWVSNALSEATRARLAAPRETGADDEAFKAAVAADLNRLFVPPTPYLQETRITLDTTETSGGGYVLRVTVLVLLTFCCYGVQVLVAAQRRALEVQLRTEQLRSAGRMAAEVAHQIKNPLAIINNVTFSLQRGAKSPNPETSKQIEIIREEVAKADQIITQIMGYSQLSEGRVEQLNVVEELERVAQEIFPPVLHSEIQVHRDISGIFPPLLMQRRHFSDSVANLLQNAREAINGHGNVFLAARCLPDDSVEVTVADDGPGVAPDKVERIFEAYHTTKPRGTGLGLAIVKHNVELYGGSVRVESKLGNGAKFILLFPATTLLSPAE